LTDQKHNRSPDKKSQKERIKDITEKLEEGVKAVFESDRYKEYLACMSKFHSYSLNNCLLIAAQYPTATAVAGYRSWQQNFGRQVRKGEKGIKILAPCKYKVETDEKDENGDPKMMELTGFRVVSVFALEQTEGKELPSIGVDELTGDVKDYQRIFNALVSISPVPVGFEEIGEWSQRLLSRWRKTHRHQVRYESGTDDQNAFARGQSRHIFVKKDKMKRHLPHLWAASAFFGSYSVN